jgi:diguanylate cyclase (GGDEF)-like protein
VSGRSCWDAILAHCDETGRVLCHTGCPLAATIHDGQKREVNAYLKHRDGRRVPVVVRAAPIRGEAGEVIGAIETFSDNSTLLNALEQVRSLQDQAQLDPLTQVGNRRSAELRLQLSVQSIHEGGRPVGLLFLDVDHFKRVNDRYGHSTGDALLRLIAATLRSNLRSDDFIGRWGGEEFIVLLTGVSSPAVLQRVAEKLRALVARSALPELELAATLSIGATLLAIGDSPECAIARADGLMYRAKALGRNRVEMG